MTQSKRSFPHERLDVFHAALDLVEGVETLARRIPSGHAHLRDQLRRSAGAALGNVVEGGECAGWLAAAARFLDTADRIGAMTYGLARTWRSRAP
jgi:hypothetical protein